MKELQIWKDENQVFQEKTSKTEELFQDDKFQTIFYSLMSGETLTITPEPYPVSIMAYVLEGKLSIHSKTYQEILNVHNSILLSDNQITYMIEALEFSKLLVITSTEVQSADNSEDYLEILRKAERKDKGTWGHGRRVGKIAMRIAQEYDAAFDLISLGKAATLHDIGKINTPTEILLKPGKLTEEEFEVIKKHPIDSYEILKESCSSRVTQAVLQHHEKLDGTGYPYGLKGDEIGDDARIIAIADVFDAMTSIRSYHEAARDDYVLQYIESHPEAFDMRFVNILKKLVADGTIDYIRTLLEDNPQ